MFGKEKDDRERAMDKFFSRQKKSLHDIVPKGASRVIDDMPEDDDEEPVQHPHASRGFARRRRRGKHPSWRLWVAGAAGVLFAGGALAAFILLPKADIALTLRQEPWEFGGEVRAKLAEGEVPLQVFTEQKNAELPYLASGREHVSRKAHGTISVCNAFNSSPQPLVARTRFLTPDDILFRLDNAVTVPGAKVTDGKIEPQCIEADVTADKAGEEYNVGPVERWSIPGFKDSPRYEGFYGATNAAMRGGVVGEVPVPTKEDIANAKEASRARIKEIIEAAFAVQAPPGITVLASNSHFVVLRESVREETDAEGNFYYFIEARDERVGIKSVDVEALMQKRAESEFGGAITFASTSLSMEVSDEVRAADGALTEAGLAVLFRAGIVPELNLDRVRENAAGRSEGELREYMLEENAIEGARVVLWPFWVKTVPTRLHKINITSEIGPLSAPTLPITPSESATSTIE